LFTIHFLLIRGSRMNLTISEIFEFLKVINSVCVLEAMWLAMWGGLARKMTANSPVSAGPELAVVHATAVCRLSCRSVT